MAKYTWSGRYRPNAFTPDNVVGAGSGMRFHCAMLPPCGFAVRTRINALRRNPVTTSFRKAETGRAAAWYKETTAGSRCSPGYSFVNDVVQMQPRVTGVFEDINTPFDPSVNKCVVDMTAAAALRASLAGDVSVKIIGTKDAGGAKIGAVTNTVTGAKDGTVPIGDDVIIEGEKIKILDETDEGQGVFFVDSAGTEHRVSRKLTVNKPGQLIARVPAGLAEGSVTLLVRTKFTGSGTTLKEVRELKYAYALTAVKP